MQQFIDILTGLTQWCLAPLAAWPLVALLVCSVIVGVLMAVVFRFTSNQGAIRRAADLCRADILSIKLFQDDLVGMFRSLGRLVAHSWQRIRYSLPPMLVMIVPFVLLMTQLALYYERQGLSLQEPAIVELQMDRQQWARGQHAELQPASGINVEAGPLRDVQSLAVLWRIRPVAAVGNGKESKVLWWKIDDQLVEKRLVLSREDGMLQPVNGRRAGPSWWERILYPGEGGLDRDAPVCAAVVHYPPRQTRLWGWDIPWWLTFVVVSMLAALVVRPLVRVEF